MKRCYNYIEIHANLSSNGKCNINGMSISTDVNVVKQGKTFFNRSKSKKIIKLEN